MRSHISILTVFAALLGTAACGNQTEPLAPSADLSSASLDAAAPAAAAALDVSAVTVSVSVTDDVFTPKTAKAKQGDTIQWNFMGPSAHTATDNTGMGLFDSGPKLKGSTFSYTYVGAGSYKYRCTIHDGMTGNVKIPVKVAPASGGTGTSFSVTWSSAAPPAGFVFDVQIKRPGTTAFVDWKQGATSLQASFVPDAGTGTYSFKARLRKLANGKASQYSPTKSISVI